MIRQNWLGLVDSAHVFTGIFFLIIIIIILLVLSHTILFTSNWECFFDNKLTLQFWQFVVEICSNPSLISYFPFKL